MPVHTDVESASDVELPKVGAYVYAAHPSTRLLCMSYAVDDGGIYTWTPGQPVPAVIVDRIESGDTFHAHNATFERLMWHHLPSKREPDPKQWRCTMAQCRSAGLPGSLEKAAVVAGLEVRKDMIGKKNMLKASRGEPYDAAMLHAYCQQDVAVERALHNLLPALTDDEEFIYYINERMNDRGVPIDLAFVQAIQPYLDAEAERLNAQMAAVTGGVVTKLTQVQRLAKWVGVESLDKRRVTLDQFHGEHREAVAIRQLGAKSSASKYKTVEAQLSPDHRLRGQSIYAGAGQTGRFSSKGAQLHNLPRDVLADADERIDYIKHVSAKQYQLVYGGPIIHHASHLLRPMIEAPEGRVLVVGDWKAIEAICVPWMAGNTDELAVWAEGDKYVDDAEAIGETDRQVGKVVRLALQFCGGTGALMQMSAQYGMDLDAQFCERAVAAWREANPWVLEFGNRLERAARRAVRRPGEMFEVGPVTYGAMQWGDKLVLRCLLPSGRVITYYDVEADGRGALSAVKPREGVRADLWRGIFVENCAQAICNDFLRAAMAEAYGRNWPLIWTVHDELVLEMALRDGLVEDVRRMMEIRPAWAPDFPLTAKVETVTRYSK